MFEQIYQKLSDEYDEFIGNLKKEPADKIIFEAPTICAFHDILSVFRDNFLGDDEISELLKLENPLNTIYEEFTSEPEIPAEAMRRDIKNALRERIADK